MNSMDKIVENEDRIDMLNRQLQMAENNFKRTGADSALTQMRARRERIDQIEAKNAELKQNAEIAQAQVGASVYGVQVGADVRKDIARQNVMARVAAALGSNKGGFTDKQLDELYDKVEMQNRGRLEDLYKDKYYGPALEQKIAEELVKLTTQRAKQASTIRQKGGIAAPSDGSEQWSVQQIEAGVD
jgi:predicted nuclease with TOPRIM domain